MGIHRLNHAVLYVHNARKSVEFYTKALGFTIVREVPGRISFLQAPGSRNDHDLGLLQIGPQAGPTDAGTRTVGMYHLAWEVDTLQDLNETAARLTELGSLVGASDHGTSKSLYAKDPDGLEFEVEWMVPLDQLTDADLELCTSGGDRLNIPREIARFGADRPGGTGISRPELPAQV